MRGGAPRAARVAEEIRSHAAMILRELKDPRIGFVSVVSAELSTDLRYVKLFVSVYGPEAERKATMTALKRATGYVRTALGQRVRLYHTPEVRFVEDRSMAFGEHINRLLRDVHPEQDGGESEGQRGEDEE